MKKLALAALLMGVSVSSYAETETCKQYYAAVDTFITEAGKHKEAASQVDMLKTQLAESKKQMEGFSVEQQDSSCKLGLDAMKQLSAAMGIK